MSPRGPRETTKVGRILNFGQLGGKTFSLQSAVITAVEDNGQQEEKQGSGYERDCVANPDMESGWRAWEVIQKTTNDEEEWLK